MLRLDFFKNTILILQVGIHFRRVFQDEGDRPVDLGQRTDGWISFENGLRRAPTPEVVGQSVETNTRSGDIVAAVMDLDVFVCWNHDRHPTSFYRATDRSAASSGYREAPTTIAAGMKWPGRAGPSFQI